jgi:hypothetical protein
MSCHVSALTPQLKGKTLLVTYVFAEPRPDICMVYVVYGFFPRSFFIKIGNNFGSGMAE